MASIERRERNGKTTWRVVWRDPETGRKRSRSFDREGNKNNPGAKQFKAEIEGSINTGNYYDPDKGKITVGEWADKWLAAKGKMTPSTRERYAGIIRTHIKPRWGSTPLSRVSHEDVQAWATALPGAPATQAKTHRVLSMMLAWAVKSGRIVKNPAEGVELDKPHEPEQLFLDHDQLDRLATACGPFWRLMVLFLGYTGLRWGEMAALKVGRLDLDKRRATIAESVTVVSGQGLVWGLPKSWERRSVPIPRFLVNQLRQHVAGKAKDDLVFRGPRGAVAQARKFQNAALTDAAISMQLCDFVPDPARPGELTAVNVLHPHQLRHTAASLAIASGADIKVVQQMLGHKDAAMTLNRYGHLFPDRLDVVADAMDAARTAALLARVPPASPRVDLTVIESGSAS